MEWKVVKGIGGLYTLTCEGNTVTAKPRGVLRKQGKKPLVGDIVRLSTDSEGMCIEDIVPRKNLLIRPPVANVDNVLFVIAVKDPKPDLLLLDRLIIASVKNNIGPGVIINKAEEDRSGAEALVRQYNGCCGGRCRAVSLRNDTRDNIINFLSPGVTVLAGQSGVGKSTLTNLLLENQVMETGEISSRADRGRQTTRHTELFQVGEGKFIIDSPGFSIFDMELLPAEEVALYYPEIGEGECRFQNCCHTGEPGCRVTELVKSGIFPEKRYLRYKEIVAEMREKEKYKYK